MSFFSISGVFSEKNQIFSKKRIRRRSTKFIHCIFIAKFYRGVVLMTYFSTNLTYRDWMFVLKRWFSTGALQECATNYDFIWVMKIFVFSKFDLERFNCTNWFFRQFNKKKKLMSEWCNAKIHVEDTEENKQNMQSIVRG